MIQFQRSTRLEQMSEQIVCEGIKYTLVMKKGNPGAERAIREWQYNHRGIKTKVYDPDGRGFYYLYAEVI